LAEDARLVAYWLTLVAFGVLFVGVVVGIVAALVAIAGAVVLRQRDRRIHSTDDPETVVRRS
jgi:uncharacterized membrane protein YagU involved in acid resistance